MSGNDYALRKNLYFTDFRCLRYWVNYANYTPYSGYLFFDFHRKVN